MNPQIIPISQDEYNALSNKSPYNLYFCLDTQRLYKNNVVFCDMKQVNTLNNSLTCLQDNAIQTDEQYDNLGTENKGALSAINEVNEKIRGYLQNIQISNAHLKDNDESLLTSEDGRPLVIENPIYGFDNTVSDIYTVVQNISNDKDYTSELKKALNNSKKIVYLSKGNFKIYDIRVFSASNYVLRGHSPESTKISYWKNADATLLYQQIQYQNNITFENIHFDGFPDITFTDSQNITFRNCKFTNFTTHGTRVTRCKNCKFIDCVYDEIGITIVDHTSAGFAIQVNKSTDTLVQGCSFNEVKGNVCVQFLSEIENFVFRDNLITNSVFGGVGSYSAVQAGVKPVIIEDNIFLNIGFGTPSPNNKKENGVVTGVGCAAIYCGGPNTDGFPNSVVRNNLIYRCREVSIEGDWQVVENNTILYSGVDSDIRPTPSRSNIHVKHKSAYAQFVRNNYCVNTVDVCISTIMAPGIGELVIQGNYLCQTENKAVTNMISQPKKLIIKDNYIYGELFINTRDATNISIFDYLVIDNNIMKFSYVAPLVFKSGYIDLRDGTRDTDIYSKNATRSGTVVNSDGSININKWGYVQRKSQNEGYLFNDDTNTILWLKLAYNSSQEYTTVKKNISAVQVRLSYSTASNSQNTVLLPGTSGEDMVLNVLMCPNKIEDNAFTCRISNSSNWWGADYCDLKLNYVKAITFVKEVD